MALNRASVRKFANLTGRGRTPKSAIESYLRSNPAEARAFAREVGLPVSERGRLSDATIKSLVDKA
jgi:hypothetical protein